MRTLFDEARRFIGRPWNALASVLGLLTVATWVRHLAFPSEAVSELLDWLGINSDWPENVHTWMNAAERHDGLALMIQLALVLLVASHAHHAWGRAKNDDHVDSVRDTEGVEAAREYIGAVLEYDNARTGQLYASLWVVVALYAEVGRFDARAAVLLLAGLIAGSALSLRGDELSLQNRAQLLPMVLGVELFAVFLALVSLPLGVCLELVLPKRVDV